MIKTGFLESPGIIIIPKSVKKMGANTFIYTSTRLYCEAESRPGSWDYAGSAYWFSQTQKSGCWHYDTDGVTPVLW